VTSLRVVLIGVLLGVTACASPPRREPGQGKWITVDPTTQRYAISADRVPRGELLDELRRLAAVDVRPSPPRDDLVTVQARDLDLTQVLAQLLPGNTRAVTRWGEQEAGAGALNTDKRKQGVPASPAAGSVAKSDRARETISPGDLKEPADTAVTERPVAGPAAIRALSYGDKSACSQQGAHSLDQTATRSACAEPIRGT
jgi:hypothetical protein